jgi:O-methyltransferase
MKQILTRVFRDSVKSALGGFGYEIHPTTIPSVIGGRHYAPLRPLASYSPWLDDHRFREIFERLRPHTLVDECRCYELWDLVGQAGHLTGSLLEVGVWRGGTGALIAHRAKLLPGAPTTYLCDTFAGVVKATNMDSTYRGGEHADTSEQHVRDLLSELAIDNAEILVGVFPDEHKETIANERFRFVHVDVDVYKSARDIVDFVWPRIAVGGVVAFDDFGFVACDGIAKLVEEYRGDRDKLVIYNLNGHGLVVKIA